MSTRSERDRIPQDPLAVTRSWQIAAKVLLVVSCATGGFALGAYLAAPSLPSLVAGSGTDVDALRSGLWGLPPLAAVAVGGLIGAAVGAAVALGGLAVLRRLSRS